MAIWANPLTFNSILVHPMVLHHHSPIYLSTALDRLKNRILYPNRVFAKVHMNTYRMASAPLKDVVRTPDEFADTYGHVRELVTP